MNGDETSASCWLVGSLARLTTSRQTGRYPNHGLEIAEVMQLASLKPGIVETVRLSPWTYYYLSHNFLRPMPSRHHTSLRPSKPGDFPFRTGLRHRASTIAQLIPRYLHLKVDTLAVWGVRSERLPWLDVQFEIRYGVTILYHIICAIFGKF